MNKEKQLKEMTKVYYEAMLRAHPIDVANGKASTYYATAFYNAGYSKQNEIIKEFTKRFEYHLRNATFTLGQTNDIQYALKKATEEMKGGTE